MNPSPIDLAGTALFAVAVAHTFLTKYFERLARRRPAHAGIWHLLGEVEVVFGFWALIFVLIYAGLHGTSAATHYLEGLNYTEPVFVFVIMVVAASRPIVRLAALLVRGVARLVPLPRAAALYAVTLALTPLLGSLITEPAAMTLAALMLRDHFFAQGPSTRLKYITLGVLFVNVSIGGTLTPYAAPPVLMVAAKWNWDLAYMLTHFGWRAALAVVVNAALATALCGRELRRLTVEPSAGGPPVPIPMTLVHLGFLAAVIVFAHHPVVFLGLFLFFLGIAGAYPAHQDRLMLREGLLVAFFLAGLVVLGTPQRWWLQEALTGMSPAAVYYGATALTAITDNAALTYLGSLVEGVDASFKYALVAGAVTGGGLTVIANAPNPAAFAILRSQFDDGAISPVYLFLAACVPTVIAIIAFRAL